MGIIADTLFEKNFLLEIRFSLPIIIIYQSYNTYLYMFPGTNHCN